MGWGWFPGDQSSAIYLVKGKQLFAGEVLLLRRSMILPELRLGLWNKRLWRQSGCFLLPESFILVEFLFPWFSCSLSVNAGLPVLCKSLPPGSTVLLGHPRFQKEHVIVSGKRVAWLSVSWLHDICFAFRLSIVSIPQSGRQDGSVLIRSGAWSWSLHQQWLGSRLRNFWALPVFLSVCPDRNYLVRQEGAAHSWKSASQQ